MRYQLSDFRKSFIELMHCTPEYSVNSHEFKTTIDKTEIVAEANHYDHISSITITTQLSTGLFASENIKKKQLGTHVKSYVMAVGSLINMDALEFQMVIENMFRTIPYSGKGIISEQHRINNGWEVTIKVPVSDFETRLYEYNKSLSKSQTIPQVETFETLFSAKSFIFNMNRNMLMLDSYGIKITEVNVGEIEGTPIMFVQFSNDSFFFLQMESDYKHLTSVYMMKNKEETISAFTQKEMAALLCFIPDRAKAASFLMDNFLKNEIFLPVTKRGTTKKIKILRQLDPENYVFSINGNRYS
ncbi:MAG: hypothetical protein IJI07_03445 [Flexilinea sp.]|nr:hypothetical protein [Flexilinea sp.]